MLLTEEQLMVQKNMRQIARDVIAPRIAEIDEKDEYPWDIFKVFAQQGLFEMAVPAEYGGAGTSKVTLCIAVEELAKVSLACCGILTAQELGLTPIEIGGSEAHKKKYFPKLAKGETISAFGLTEPGAGSDSAAMKTRAVPQGGNYVLNGDKCFITNGDIASVISVFAKTGSTGGVKDISAFVVDGDTKGLTRGKKERKMGIHGLTTAQLFFTDCSIPRENLLGKEGEGFKIAMRTLDLTRPTVAAQALGVAQGALDVAIEYAKQRVQFGQPISSNQGLQWMIADRAMEIEAARQLTYHAASLIDANNPDVTRVGSMAKCFASDVAMRTTVDAVQIMGGYGYMKDYPLERMMRDAKITQIWEGTNQIQRTVISRILLK